MLPASLDNPLAHTHELRWLYIDFNSYFASVEQQLRPELRGRPVAVVPVATDSTCAIAASYEAKAFGIKTGTPIYEARKKCPDLACVLATHERYVEYHHRILEEVDRHIPVASVCSIDEVACQLMDNERSHARTAEIAAAIKRGLAKNVGEYIKCSIGVAPNRYLAKVATDMQKPDGFVTLLGNDILSRLMTLKLRDLPGVGMSMERRLYMAGIYDMKALLSLPPKRMRAIWGNVWGEKMWYLLRGVDLPDEETHRSTIGHSHVMSPELRAPERARYVARRLTLKAASRLRRMGYYASGFMLSVRIENGPRLTTERKCYRAQDSLTFLHLLDDAWQELTSGMHNQRIKKVSMCLHHLTQAGDIQAELFSQLPNIDLKQQAKAERMSHALDKINHRFGKDSIVIGMLPSHSTGFSGTKIAFTRIPDMEEFLE